MDINNLPSSSSLASFRLPPQDGLLGQKAEAYSFTRRGFHFHFNLPSSDPSCIYTQSCFLVCTTLFSIFKMAQGEEQQKPLNRDVGGRGGSDVSLSLQLCFINCLLYFYKHLVLEQSA